MNKLQKPSRFSNFLYGADFALFPNLKNSKSRQILSISDKEALQRSCQQVMDELNKTIQGYD